MAIKIECPRCTTRLQVPNKLAGGYVNCPHCKGRLWVAKDAPADAVQAETVGISPPAAVPATAASAGPMTGSAPSAAATRSVAVAGAAPSSPAARPPLPSAGNPGSALRPAAPWTMAPAPSPPPPPPAPRKKVAHFITAEAADSTLRLAADGKLPELHLEEGKGTQKQEAKARSINPLVMLGALSMSVVMSVILALVDVDSPQQVGVPQKNHARQTIEDNYFGSGNLDNKDLAPYQVLLRAAQRAHARGDVKTERAQYHKVLDMLRAERGTHEKGLTGSRSRDKDLEEAISVLLSGG